MFIVVVDPAITWDFSYNHFFTSTDILIFKPMTLLRYIGNLGVLRVGPRIQEIRLGCWKPLITVIYMEETAFIYQSIIGSFHRPLPELVGPEYSASHDPTSHG